MERENSNANINIEYIVRYEFENNDYNKNGPLGIPLLIEMAIPYKPAHHIRSIGMVSYTPKENDETNTLQELIQRAYDNGIISSYEKLEKNITLKDEREINS